MVMFCRRTMMVIMMVAVVGGVGWDGEWENRFQIDDILIGTLNSTLAT